jgi:hypothetical protein
MVLKYGPSEIDMFTIMTYDSFMELDPYLLFINSIRSEETRRKYQGRLTGYSGEKFEIPWKDRLQLFRIYSKEISKKKTMKIRKETQEYPNKSLEDAFMDKISSTADEKP